MSPRLPEITFMLSIQGLAQEAERAIASLAPECQRKVEEADYEIVVVERASDDVLGAERATRIAGNVRYTFYEDRAISPVAALKASVSATTAPSIAVIDGPCRVTPRLVEHAIAAVRLGARPIVVVPTYRLAESDEHPSGSNADAMRDGYEVLEHASFSPINPNGYLGGLLEARLFIVPRATLEAVTGEFRGRPATCERLATCDDLFGELTTLPDARLIVLGGEGCVEPPAPAREVDPERNLRVRWARQPVLFGVVSGPVNEFLRVSIAHAAMHEALARKRGALEWRHDFAAPRGVDAGDGPLAANASVQTPRLSIVVVVFRIPEQAANTIFSLSTRYQLNVSDEDYEIIVVENRSSHMLGEERARRLGRNVRYFAREERGVSPAPALNFGVARARGELVGLMVDGARLATPRVVENVLLTRRLDPRPLVVVPGFHLGPGLQHVTSRQGYDSAAEQRLLDSIEWKGSGYRLFEAGVFDEASKSGFLNPMLECTCLFCAKSCLDEIGGMDERFDLPGGGEVNHDLFDRLCRLERTKYVVLWGEGTFHQFHGGVSTGSLADREARLETFRRQYDAIRGRRFATYEREPTLLGTCAERGHQALMEAVALGRLRYGMKCAAGEPEWPND